MSSNIFGPVPSRRLGRSLGIDLIPFKTCTYDCIYCQLGRTTEKTVERRSWVDLDAVLESLREKVSSKPDYITLGGSGEPTLHGQIGELIDRVKAITDIPVAVLTNGSLLWKAEVRRQLMRADLVIPSLDAGDETMFRLVNRPHADLSFGEMLEGLIDFRREFRGRYWLEVFLLGGYSALADDFARIVQCVERIRPDRVQVNTVARPPAETYAMAVPPQRLNDFASRFHPPAEVIADFDDIHSQTEFVAGREEILELLRRRPCSIAGIAAGLGMHRNEIVKYVEDLAAQEQLEKKVVGTEVHYFVPS